MTTLNRQQIEALAEQNEICYRIGRVVAGDQTVQLKGGVFGA